MLNSFISSVLGSAPTVHKEGWFMDFNFSFFVCEYHSDQLEVISLSNYFSMYHSR